MNYAAPRRLAALFAKWGLRAYGAEGSTLNDLTIGPYVRVNNDRRKQLWGSRRAVVRWLELYYAHYEPEDFGARLILKRFGRFGSFLIMNHDADILDLLNSTERKRKIQTHRREFIKFCSYLKKATITSLAQSSVPIQNRSV
jgi:hypothetical protein